MLGKAAGRRKCRTGMKVQSIKVDLEVVTFSAAKRWLNDHGYKTSNPDYTSGGFVRFRQQDPDKFEKWGYGYGDEFAPGIQPLYGCPKSRWGSSMGDPGRDYIELGPSPYDEECAQVGDDDYPYRSRRETRALVHQLQRMFPRGSFGVKSFPHNFGTYREVVAYFDEENPAEVEAAYEAEANFPAKWDEEARRELSEESSMGQPNANRPGSLDEVLNGVVILAGSGGLDVNDDRIVRIAVAWDSDEGYNPGAAIYVGQGETEDHAFQAAFDEFEEYKREHEPDTLNELYDEMIGEGMSEDEASTRAWEAWQEGWQGVVYSMSANEAYEILSKHDRVLNFIFGVETDPEDDEDDDDDDDGGGWDDGDGGDDEPPRSPPPPARGRRTRRPSFRASTGSRRSAFYSLKGEDSEMEGPRGFKKIRLTEEQSRRLLARFKIPPWEELDERISESSEIYGYALNVALDEGLSKEEAEERAREAEEEERDDYYWKWKNAVLAALENEFDAVGLDFSFFGLGEGAGTISVWPTNSWEEAADKIREIIDGTGYFQFNTLDEFLRSGPYTAREAVALHLGWISDRSEVYGTKSARDIYFDTMR